MATFGHTGVGASQLFNGTGYIYGSKFTAPEAGTLTKISVHIVGYTSPTNLRCGIYADSGGSPAGLLASAASDTPVTAGSTWYDSTVSYAFLASTVYWLAVMPEAAGTSIAYDTPGDVSNQTAILDGMTYPTFPDPWNETFLDYKLSIYGTYTPAASGNTAGIIIEKA